MPPHLKNQDTVVLNLNGVGPTDIPDGYELIPLDKLTSDHEVREGHTLSQRIIKVDE